MLQSYKIASLPQCNEMLEWWLYVEVLGVDRALLMNTEPFQMFQHQWLVVETLLTSCMYSVTVPAQGVDLAVQGRTTHPDQKHPFADFMTTSKLLVPVLAWFFRVPILCPGHKRQVEEIPTQVGKSDLNPKF